MVIKYHSWIKIWLALCAALVVCMVLVGGYTRLSGSGLSITEWKPIHGVIPPMGEEEWQEEFEKYQQIPQYQHVNMGMTLEEFQDIYWPEYWHRNLGRLIGLVFFFPLVGFYMAGSLHRRFALRLAAIFALGGLQGAMGWYMVASGLSENTHVSHFRLAAHLSLALLLFGLLIWAILDVISLPRKAPSVHEPLPTFAGTAFLLWFLILCLQIIYGAFTAGLHAGLIYNTFPTMNGKWIPNGLTTAIFSDHTTVQFIHRTLALCIIVGFAFWWFFNTSHVKKAGLTRLAATIMGVIILQFTLGVLTLIHVVPLGLGLAHQMTAVLLFGLSVGMLYHTRKM